MRPWSGITHAGGIVVRSEGGEPRYLIVRSRSDPGHWVLPKGHLEDGETPDRAAVREVREEAGVEAEVVRELGTIEFRRGDERIRVLFFLMRFLGSGRPSENRASRWLSYPEARSAIPFEDAREILDRAHALGG